MPAIGIRCSQSAPTGYHLPDPSRDITLCTKAAVYQMPSSAEKTVNLTCLPRVNCQRCQFTPDSGVFPLQVVAMSQIDRKQIRADKWMRRFMFSGVPIALISIVSLWLGQWLVSPALGQLFIVSAGAAVAIGAVYNVRFVILSLRQIRARESDQ